MHVLAYQFTYLKEYCILRVGLGTPRYRPNDSGISLGLLYALPVAYEEVGVPLTIRVGNRRGNPGGKALSV